jgi:type VI secretion system protein ImpJ
MSWNSKVIWSEGMFLEPQHLQQHDRYVERLVEGRAGPIAGNAWGFSHFALDEAAAALGKVALSRASGIFPDGTPFDFPAQESTPTPLDVPADAREVLVVLAVPLQRPQELQVDIEHGETARLTRYKVSEVNAPDVTLPSQRTALVQIADLRMKLILRSDTVDAYATLGVCRILERRKDNRLVLDSTYIPPTLAVRGDPLLSGFVDDLHGLLHQRGEALAARMSQPGRGGVAEIADFLLLQTVNRFEPVFRHLGELHALHPERLFAICLQLAGDLSTFTRDTRRPVEFPVYDHDNLAGCFAPVLAEVRRSLSMVLEQNAIPIELHDRRFGVRVAIVPDAELLRTASFVLAVNAQMSGDALRAKFPAQTKVGPVERIRDLVNLQLPGIALRSLSVAPRQIPYHAGFTYFELERTSELWPQLQKSGGLAMHIAGDFPGIELEFWAIRS